MVQLCLLISPLSLFNTHTHTLSLHFPLKSSRLIGVIILIFLFLVVSVSECKCVCVSGHVYSVENHVAHLLPVVATDVQ